MEDIRLVLKPEIDTKDVDKAMSDVAKNSATALQKTFTDLRATLSQSAKNIGDEFRIDDTLDKTLSQARKFYMEFAKISQSAVETGMLPEGIDTKMYGLLSEVNKLSKAYAEAYTEARRFADANVKAIPIGEYAKFTAELSQLNQEFNASVSAVNSYRDAIDATVEKERLIGQLKNGEKTLATYQKLTDNIEKARDALEKLKQEGMGKYVDAGGKPLDEEEVKKYRGAVGGKEQEQYLAQLKAAQEHLKNQERAINTIRKADQERIKEIQKQQAVIDRAYNGEAVSVQKITDDINKETETQKQLTTAINETKDAMESIPQGDRYKMDFNTQQDADQFSSMVDRVRKLKEELVVATTRVNEMESAANKTTINFSQWRNVVWSVSRVLGNVYTIGLDVVRGAKTIANFYKRIFDYVKRILSIFKRLRDSIRGTAKEHAKSWKDMLRDVVRYAFGIRSLFALFRRLRRYIREAFEEMAKQIPEVNKVLSELKSSLGMLKGSLATAFEPILSAVAPALNFLIEKLAQVMTYIGMFFAALTGRGYVYKATKSMQDFAKATKEANKQLQGFDELNNLTTNKDNGAEDAPMAIFKKVPVLDWIKDLADKIKAILMRIIDPIKKAWARIGPYVVAAWRRAFYNVKKLLMDIGRDFLRAWDEMGQSISEHFLEIVGDVGNIIANIAEALDTAWNANENGYKLWKAILTIVDDVLVGIRNITTDIVIWTHSLDLTPAMTAFRQWVESLEPIVKTLMDILFDIWNDALKPILTWAFDGENSGIARLFKILTDFNDKLDKSKIRENLDKVWQAIGRFGQKVGEGLLLFIERLSDRIANWVNSDKFTEFCDKIVAFLDNIEPGDIVDRLEQILRILGNILEFIWDAIQYVKDFEYMGKDILDWVETLSENLDTIAKIAVFGKLTIDLLRFMANLALLIGALIKFGGLIPMAFLGFVAAIGGAIALFVDMWKNGMDKVKETILVVLEVIAVALAAIVMGPIGAIVVAIIAVVANIALVIHEHWDAIVDWFLNTVLPWIDNLIVTIADIIAGGIGTLWNMILTFLMMILTPCAGVVNSIIELIKGFINLVITLILNLAHTLYTIGAAIVTTVMSFVKAIVTGSTEPLAKIKEAWINVWTSIKDSFRNIANSIIAMFEGMINGFISGVNAGVGQVIAKINTASEWAAKAGFLGGRAFTLNIGQIPPIKLPRLAQGAVIPPNKEFLAVLGDQKSGTNIESPLSTMVEAFNQAGGNRSEQELTLLQEQNQLLRQLIEKEWSISASQMFNAMQRQAVVYTKQSGKPAFS